MRIGILFLIIIVFILNISALCEEDQIDINSASAGELDEIFQIGPARAKQIIALRPFDSVDDLVRVIGIGEVYLANITAEGLACVNGQDEEDEEENKETTKEENIVNEERQEIEEPLSRETEPIELKTINLNPTLHDN